MGTVWSEVALGAESRKLQRFTTALTILDSQKHPAAHEANRDIIERILL